jgi:hypothetical protein
MRISIMGIDLKFMTTLFQTGIPEYSERTLWYRLKHSKVYSHKQPAAVTVIFSPSPPYKNSVSI